MPSTAIHGGSLFKHEYFVISKFNRKIKVIVFETDNKQEHNTNVSTPTVAVQEVRRHRVACEDKSLRRRPQHAGKD